MNDRDWRTLVHNIVAGNCILVLGPDLAREKTQEGYRTLSEMLSNEFAVELEKERKVFSPNDLSATAQQYADLTSEEDLRLDAAEFYNKRHTEVGSPYTDLAHIPFQLVVNATPDTLLIQALEKTGKQYFEEYYNYRGRPGDMVKWDSRDRPLIYYLYGSVKDHDSLVISEKHLLEFLVAVTAKDPPIQNNIMSEFRDKDKSFLFLGFGFRNWYLRILLYVLLDSKANSTEKTSRSFALEQIPPPDESSFQEISFLFKDNLKINFSEMTVEEFVKELRQRCEEEIKSVVPTGESASKADLPSPGTDEVAADAPTIFICHASEDKEMAMKIWERLKEGGLNPWIDKEGIRGGDAWDKLLEKQIKGVDYFVVVQSTAMADKAKKKSYVNKEIKLAQEEQLKFPDQISFILPVKIEQCESREEFTDWQCTDLTDWNNIDNLLKDIRRDQQRRKK
jgi:TIR domain/SIR2-like domain